MNAGASIWIASGTRQGCLFVLQHVRRGDQLLGSSLEREVCYPALVRWIRSQGNSAIGFDFPFGLPQRLMAAENWRDFVLGFEERFPDAHQFRRWCRRRYPDRELKRLTDVAARTPFSPYNLRMFRQTYWGIRAVLAPLVATRSARVLPMQCPVAGIPWLLETCPASTLKDLDLYRRYKGKNLNQRAARAEIFRALEVLGLLRSRDGRLTGIVTENAGGDALDAVVAAVAVARSLTRRDFPSLEARPEYRTEAVVYV